MKLTQVILSNMPNNRHPLSWLVFVLILLVMIPLLILMLLLLPLILLFNWIKLRFFPSKTPKVFATPFGFAVYSQVERQVKNYPWPEIQKVEMWSEGSAVFPVLQIQSGEVVKLFGMQAAQIQPLCQQHNIPFSEEVVIVQSEE